jgi:hypothetical protein
LDCHAIEEEEEVVEEEKEEEDDYDEKEDDSTVPQLPKQFFLRVPYIYIWAYVISY